MQKNTKSLKNDDKNAQSGHFIPTNGHT